MTHAELVLRASRWLRRSERCAIVFTEMSNVTTEHPDAIGWRSHNVSIVVECKVSRSDFLADRKKPAMYDDSSGMGRERYYMVPNGLVSVDEVPPWCGLLYCKPRTVSIERRAVMRDWNRYNVYEESVLLYSALRRTRLGTLVTTDGRWETMRAREARQDAEARTDPTDVVW